MTTYYHSTQWRFGGGDRITYTVQRLILANCAVFGLQLLLDVVFGLRVAHGTFAAPPGGVFTRWLAFWPAGFLGGAFWQPFTYMFLHGGLLHLFLNMLWLFFFGKDVERALGTRAFLRFYLTCGAVGVLATLIPAMLWGGASVTGASGAVMGVLVAFAVINPEREFFLFPIPMPINARALVLIVIAMNVLLAFQPGNTSVATHFGGMAVGFVYMKAIPFLLGLQRSHRAKERRENGGQDEVGDAVDNIFKFEDRKRRD